MNTERNRLMVLADTLDEADYALRRSESITCENPSEQFTNARDAIRSARDELRALAAVETTGAHLGASDAQIAEAKAALVGEGPSDGEMLEWVCDRLIEKRAVIGGGVAVHWIDADGEDRWTKGKDTRGAIAGAMQESGGGGDPGIAIMRAEREQWECDRCDGCGWYEGGKTIKTTCEVCGGTGVVSRRQLEDMGTT